MISIYAVTDRAGLVVYVGQSVRLPFDRLCAHLSEARGGGQSRFHLWLLGRVEDDGEGPGILLLEAVEDDLAYEREVYWIQRHLTAGAALLNGNHCNYDHAKVAVQRPDPASGGFSGRRPCNVCGLTTMWYYGTTCAAHQRSFAHLAAKREIDRDAAEAP